LRDRPIPFRHVIATKRTLIHSQRTTKHILAIIASISNAQALIFTTSMIWVLCKAGKLNDAEELFDQTETARVVPCAYTYNTILMAFATGGYTAMERITQWNLAFTGVGLVGTDIVTSLDLIGSGIAAGAGFVTSGPGPVSSGQDNISVFLWDPGGHAKDSLGTSCISRSGEC
jgi:pentatricopeptide repeat protein